MSTPKKKLSAITIRRLRRVKEAILAEPELFNQAACGGGLCGTPRCILGWAHSLFPASTPKQRARVARAAEEYNGTPTMQPWRRVFISAAAKLHLTPPQADRLWTVRNWPPGMSKAAGNLDVTSREAARRIEHFIKTDGAK